VHIIDYGAQYARIDLVHFYPGIRELFLAGLS